MTTTQTTYKVHDATGLVATVPLLLGFAPRDSLVVLCFRGRRIGPVMRVDIPPDDEVGRLSDYLVEQACRYGDGVALFCYTRRPDDTWALQRLLGTMLDAGLPVIDAMVVGDERITFLPDLDGNVAEPAPLPDPDHPEPGVDALQAAMAYTGRTVLPDRSALTDSIRPPRASGLRRARQAIKRGRAALARPRADGDESFPGWDTLTAALGQVHERGTVNIDTAAELALWMQDPLVRDAMISRMLRERSQDWLPLLISALGSVPADESADMAAVLTLIAYRRGDGALAQVATDRCLAAAPEHRLGGLLLDIMAAGIPPHLLDDLGVE